jgi:hypothetical protein
MNRFCWFSPLSFPTPAYFDAPPCVHVSEAILISFSLQNFEDKLPKFRLSLLHTLAPPLWIAARLSKPREVLLSVTTF